MIRSFRRSKRESSSSSSSSPKHNITRVASASDTDVTAADDVLMSPKKVIKALYDYYPQGPGELKFAKGDFFHVLEEEAQDVQNGWYEATNPVTHAKGMVPISYFETFKRNRPKTNGSIGSGMSTLVASTNRRSGGSSTLYAQVLYEFKAERDDELSIFPGENLIICAHHEYEWFIAKPINRLGGPGLVPVSYVKVIDLMGMHPNLDIKEGQISPQLIEKFNIPTVEQWKDMTARYQASTIPLGQIAMSNTVHTPTSHPGHSQSSYFPESNRSSLASTNTQILDAGVDSYQLDHGRYQYLVVAKLSNGRTRYLYRYYQDFYDLQVKLLELFPFEAGRMENSKRIIPSIPGPLINVNDSISKLRREKLDEYLHQLVALPANISRCDEVLRLFEVLNNGFDREVEEPQTRRASKPISQKSNYQQDRLSQYAHRTSNASTDHSRHSSTTNLTSMNPHSSSQDLFANSASRKVKVKFYYDDDIFVLLLPTSLQLKDLKTKLHQRLNVTGDQRVCLFLKNDYDDYLAEHSVDTVAPEHREAMAEFEVDDDTKFQSILYDKCKLVILVQ
ncbi:hypothetical protein DIURU_001896 [Diutina rugosa]|uniref:Bud emergence protein 1 n=1 Tax=Diutina rugosa TaxID=5481 RepID=A0A642UYZ4_DIURU|nr:uncharacterized protein DIURU_001896 [Diutina rugosa]KAA8904465.1 hypothetical protein DIURU_001896 [Diutina rugosa]